MLLDLLQRTYTPEAEAMADRIVGHVGEVCVAAHFLAWCGAAITWVVNWAQYGPAPSGPIYNGAQEFISRVDILVSELAFELTIRIAPAVSQWFSWDIGACLTIGFAFLILLAGTAQWYVLGRLVRWVAERRGRRAALPILGAYGMWMAGALFLWIAA